MNKEKIEKILGVRAPTNLRQLRGFLGTASYYRRYIMNFSRIAAPLVALTKKEEYFEQGKKQQQAFETLKEHLSREPILSLPT